jgi:3-oxoacyl-[acyl-carrier-protein] synthase-1
MKRVVVTGMGIVSSIGNNVGEVLTSLKEAKSGVRHAADYKKYDFRCQVHGEPQVDPFEVLDRRTTRFMGKGAAWNYIAVQEALKDAGLEEKDYREQPRVGMVMGSGGPSTKDVVHAADVTRERGPRRIGPTIVPKAMSSTASATLATPLGIHGVNYSISSACATSKHCIGNAYEQIQLGKQDIVLTGGHEDLHWSMSNLFDGMNAMSSNFNDNPSVASRAYDKNRDGFVIGYAATSDGFDMVAPSGEGAVRCMRMALENVVMPIDYINPHATSTPVGDSKEIEAIREVFGNEDKCPPISATKSLTGHALGATGVWESIFSILMMQHSFLCESAHIEELDPEFADMPILRQRRDNVSVGCVLSNSFGFGGTNATLVFKHPDA